MIDKFKNIIRFTQPYQVAAITYFNKNSNYIGIVFLPKPDRLIYQTNPEIKTIDVTISWYNQEVFSKFCSKELNYLAIIGCESSTDDIQVMCFNVTNVHRADTSLTPILICDCKSTDAFNSKCIDKIKAAYRRNFKNAYDIISKKINEVNMTRSIPKITRCIVNDPAVICFWSDDTKTIGKAMPGDVFNPEVGLAMAISRKYYELIGYSNVRASFKKQIKNAEYYGKSNQSNTPSDEE